MCLSCRAGSTQQVLERVGDIHSPTYTKCDHFPRSRNPNDTNDLLCLACRRNNLLWKAYKKYITLLCYKWSLTKEREYMEHYCEWDTSLKDDFEYHVAEKIKDILKKWW